eukprot:1195532-Prorocentrum_minimum.AAC.4
MKMNPGRKSKKGIYCYVGLETRRGAWLRTRSVSSTTIKVDGKDKGNLGKDKGEREKYQGVPGIAYGGRGGPSRPPPPDPGLGPWGGPIPPPDPGLGPWGGLTVTLTTGAPACARDSPCTLCIARVASQRRPARTLSLMGCGALAPPAPLRSTCAPCLREVPGAPPRTRRCVTPRT